MLNPIHHKRLEANTIRFAEVINLPYIQYMIQTLMVGNFKECMNAYFLEVGSYIEIIIDISLDVGSYIETRGRQISIDGRKMVSPKILFLLLTPFSLFSQC